MVKKIFAFLDLYKLCMREQEEKETFVFNYIHVPHLMITHLLISLDETSCIQSISRYHQPQFRSFTADLCLLILVTVPVQRCVK